MRLPRMSRIMQIYTSVYTERSRIESARGSRPLLDEITAAIATIVRRAARIARDPPFMPARTRVFHVKYREVYGRICEEEEELMGEE